MTMRNLSATESFMQEFGCLISSTLPEPIWLSGKYKPEERQHWQNLYDEHCHPAHVPERVIYNGTTTIAIFPDGKKIKSRPDKGAIFDKETGLAMCIVKHVYGTRAKFLKAIEKANDQNEKEHDA